MNPCPFRFQTGQQDVQTDEQRGDRRENRRPQLHATLHRPDLTFARSFARFDSLLLLVLDLRLFHFQSAVFLLLHLIQHGHRRIAFIGGQSTLSTEQARYAGFVDAMAKAGLQVVPAWVHHGAQDSDEAKDAALAILTGAERPTAVFSGQNLITMGTVRALRELSLQHRVALVGFDDFVLADLLDPAITVVAQDARAIGHLAGELLFRRMEDATQPTATHVVPSTLVTRGSGEIPPE